MSSIADDRTITVNIDEEGGGPSIAEQLHEQRDKIGGFVREAMFDTRPYTAPKATIDGNLADDIAVKFSGSWEPSVEFFDGLKLGQTITLSVEVEVISKKAELKNAGEDATVTGTAAVKVIDVYIPAPETL